MTISELEKQLRQRDSRIEEQAARIKELEREIGELKKLLVEKAQSKEAKPPKDANNYSVDRHEKKRHKKRRKKSTGRRPNRQRCITISIGTALVGIHACCAVSNLRGG